jgi:hypothetical protein
MHAFIFGLWSLQMFAAPSEVDQMIGLFTKKLGYLVKTGIQGIEKTKRKAMK